MNDYKHKYLKYKQKYRKLKIQKGGLQKKFNIPTLNDKLCLTNDNKTINCYTDDTINKFLCPYQADKYNN